MKNKIILVLSILFGLYMIFAGVMKFAPAGEPEMSETGMKAMMSLASIKWFFPLVGIVEIIGGILLAVPKTRIIGALTLLPVFVGIVLFHIFDEPNGLILSVAMFAVLLFILGAACDKIKLLLN